MLINFFNFKFWRMSSEIIKYSIDELLALFISTDPPEFLCDVSSIFVEEARTPIANYPKNVSKVTVLPKNTALKVAKSEPIKNEQDPQTKVSDFTPKPISNPSDTQKSPDFIPTFNPASASATDKIKIPDSPITSQNYNFNINPNSNPIENAHPIVNNQIPQNVPVFVSQDSPVFVPQSSPILVPQDPSVFVPQDPPIFVPQDPPIFVPQNASVNSSNLQPFVPQNPPSFIPQNPSPFPSPDSSVFYPQYPPGFYSPDYYDISDESQFTPQLSIPSSDQMSQLPIMPSEQPPAPFLNNIETSYNSNSSNINKEQMDCFESVIEGTTGTSSSHWTKPQENTFINSKQQTVPSQQFIPPQQPQFQPQLEQAQFPKSFEQIQKVEEVQQQIQPHFEQKQNQKTGEKRQQQRNQQFTRQLSNESQKTNKQRKNEKKSKSVFSADTVVEDVKDVKITPWGAKSKPSPQSFQDIMQSAETDELVKSTPNTPMVISTKPTSSKISISTSTSKFDNNNGTRSKKSNRYLSSIGSNEIPKPKDFTVDNIAISTGGESVFPPKSFVIYNSKNNINSNTSIGTHMQINSSSNNNSKMNKPVGFNPANIAIPPNFSNNIYPP